MIRPTTLLCVLAATLGATHTAARTARAQTGTGAPYGARDPHSCASRNVPARGAPTPAQIARYMQCEHERELAGQLYVYEPITVTGVAAGRPYNPIEDRNMGNVDVRAPVYAFRGSYRSYSCSRISPGSGMASLHAGSNCAVTEHPHAAGLCNKDTFGDWHCYMSDPRASDPQRNVAAPTS